MDAPEPAPAELRSQPVDRGMMASAEPFAAFTRARLLVRMPLFHGGQSREFRYPISSRCAEQEREVLANPIGSVIQFAEWHGMVLFKVRASIQIGNNACLDKTQE
jgi:hypothetical protein